MDAPLIFLIGGGMDLDPTLRGGLELGLKICPVKTSSHARVIKRSVFVGVRSLTCLSPRDSSLSPPKTVIYNGLTTWLSPPATVAHDGTLETIQAAMRRKVALIVFVVG